MCSLSTAAKFWLSLVLRRKMENKRKQILAEHQRRKYTEAVRKVLKNPQYIEDPEESGLPSKTGTSTV